MIYFVFLFEAEGIQAAIKTPWLIIISAVGLFITIVIGFYRSGKLQGGIKTSLKTLGSEVSIVKKKVNYLELVNKVICTVLSTKFDVDPLIFKDSSPTTLTKLGTEILVETGGKEYIDNNLNSLLERLGSMDFTTQLDIQNNAFYLLVDLASGQEMSNIKDFIFEHSSYSEIKLNIPTVVKIMSFYLRDLMLESISFDSNKIPEE